MSFEKLVNRTFKTVQRMKVRTEEDFAIKLELTEFSYKGLNWLIWAGEVRGFYEYLGKLGANP